MTRIWDESPYSHTMLLLHIAMGDAANDEGEFWYRQETLAKKARVSVRYVKTVVAQMKNDGYLTTRRMGRQNRYALQWPEQTGEHSSPIQSGKGNSATPRQGNSVTPVKNRHPNRHITEPSERTTSSRGHEDVDMKPIGQIEPEPEPETPSRFPLTFRGTVDYFQHEARVLRAHGEVERLRRVVSDLHKKHGLSYDQIQGAMRLFFTNYELEIRDSRREYSAVALFQTKLVRILNQNPAPQSEANSTYIEPEATRILREQLRS